MFRDSRAEIAEMVMGLVDSARTLGEMRDAEAFLEEVKAGHGPYDLVVGGIEEISRRILYMEVGQGEEKMALTQQEEDVLRRVARDNTPMKAVNPGAHDTTGTAASEGAHLDGLVKRLLAAPRTLTGMAQDGKYHLEGEDDIVRRIAHTMKKGEKLIQWFARVGLGRSQILQMSKSEISAFVEQAERNNSEGPREPEPAPMPAVALVPSHYGTKLRTTTVGYGWDDSDVEYA